jgi:hypothetical protein
VKHIQSCALDLPAYMFGVNSKVLDEEDELRAILHADQEGAVGLEFLAGGEVPRLSVGVNQTDTAFMSLRDDNGQVRSG